MRYFKSLLLVLKSDISRKDKMLVTIEFIVNLPKHIVLIPLYLIYFVFTIVGFVFEKVYEFMDIVGYVFKEIAYKIDNTRDIKVIRDEEKRKEIIKKVKQNIQKDKSVVLKADATNAYKVK